MVCCAHSAYFTLTGIQTLQDCSKGLWGDYNPMADDLLNALRSEDDALLWRQPLGSTPGVWFSFYPPFILDGAVYLVCSDKRGKAVLYALDAQTGAECWRWQTSPPSAIAPLAAAQ